MWTADTTSSTGSSATGASACGVSESAAGPVQALRRANAALYGTIQQQATLLGYVWIVRNLALACALFVPLILLLVKRNQPGAAAMGGH